MHTTLHATTRGGLQPPDLRGLQVIAIVVLRQRDGRCTVAHRMLGQAVNQLTAAATDDDARLRHAMEGRQLRTQVGVMWIRVLGRVRGLQRRHRRRAGATGIAVGREIMRGHAQRIGAAMHHGHCFRLHHLPTPTLSSKPKLTAQTVPALSPL